MKKNICIVDDDKWISELVKRFLDFEKFQVDRMYEFSSEAEIIEQITKKNYECILIDYMLVCCNGIELGKKIRQQSLYTHTPFILVTTMPLTPELSHQLLSVHMKYLKKPFTKTELVKTIYDAMSTLDEDSEYTP